MARKRKNSKQETPEKREIDLAKKYRPTTLDDFIAGPTLKKEIKTTLDNEIPQAVLFYGEYGCGKTTLARMFAKHLETSEFDLKEVDIADFSGVATIREIRKNMGTKPMKGKAKVWILDEVQKLSTDGQQALLKALEEPPSHCYFFLCTTDPQNLKSTVKSRCVQYHVPSLGEKQIFNLLMSVAEREQIDMPKKAALQIAKDALGHPRDALKILEKVMFMEPDEMEDSAKREAEKRQDILTLSRLMMKKCKWKQVAEVLKNMTDKPETIRRGIRTYFKSVLLSGNESAFIVLDTLQTPYYNTDEYNQLVRDIYECWSELNE